MDQPKTLYSWSEYRIAVLDTLKRLEDYCNHLQESKAEHRELTDIIKQVANLATQLSVLQVESAITKTKLALWVAIPSSVSGGLAAFVLEQVAK